jgi:hypothetical protein
MTGPVANMMQPPVRLYQGQASRQSVYEDRTYLRLELTRYLRCLHALTIELLNRWGCGAVSVFEVPLRPTRDSPGRRESQQAIKVSLREQRVQNNRRNPCLCSIIRRTEHSHIDAVGTGETMVPRGWSFLGGLTLSDVPDLLRATHLAPERYLHQRQRPCLCSKVTITNHARAACLCPCASPPLPGPGRATL